MTRINVADALGDFAGWFESTTATRIEGATRWDGQNMVYTDIGAPRDFVDYELIRTAGGRWILHSDARRYFAGRNRYTYASESRAGEWLLRNGRDSEYEEYFGPIPDEYVIPPISNLDPVSRH